MITYKTQRLTKIRRKNGGKNQTLVDGFYQDDTGALYFVKQPADKKEIFTEFLAGLFLQEWMKQGLIETHYHPSLICADIVKLDDETYALIQPCIEFTELYKIIDTGYTDNSDRSARYEMVNGLSCYSKLPEKIHHLGLSVSLMFSLLLGDNSVHSGNVVCLHSALAEDHMPVQCGRIDWGASFRDFAHEQNDDILLPRECRGPLNYKYFSKRYIEYYKNIPGLFSAIADQARRFDNRLSPDSLFLSAINALQKIPVDLLDEKDKQALADYMCIPAMRNASFGENSEVGEVAEALKTTLQKRLEQIKNLESTPRPEQLDRSFPELIQDWKNRPGWSRSNYQKIDIRLLKKQYNHFVTLLAKRGELFNLWGQPKRPHHNIFAPYYKGNHEAQFGAAFVAECRESAVLRRLYTIDPDTNGFERLQPFEEPIRRYSQEHPESYWALVNDVLIKSHELIFTLEDLKRRVDNNEGTAEPSPQFHKQLVNLSEIMNQLPAEIPRAHTTPAKSHFFYPISNKKLSQMNGAQLATICLQELQCKQPSPLVRRIVTNDETWEKTDLALSGNAFKACKKKDEKYEKLKELRHTIIANRQELSFDEEELDGASSSSSPKILNEDSPSHSDADTPLDQDLDTLLRFKETALRRNKDNRFGNAYNNSIERFYDNAVIIRRSKSPIKTQAEEIIKLAEREFKPRHSTRRLIADVVMLIGTLFAGAGLAFGIGRVLTGRSFFFSDATPNRLQTLRNNWLDCDALEGQGNKVFVCPVA